MSNGATNIFDHAGIGIGSALLALITSSLPSNATDWMSFLNDLERLIAGGLFIGISAITLVRKLKNKN